MPSGSREVQIHRMKNDGKLYKAPSSEFKRFISVNSIFRIPSQLSAFYFAWRQKRSAIVTPLIVSQQKGAVIVSGSEILIIFCQSWRQKWSGTIRHALPFAFNEVRRSLAEVFSVSRVRFMKRKSPPILSGKYKIRKTRCDGSI